MNYSVESADSVRCRYEYMSEHCTLYFTFLKEILLNKQCWKNSTCIWEFKDAYLVPHLFYITSLSSKKWLPTVSSLWHNLKDIIYTSSYRLYWNIFCIFEYRVPFPLERFSTIFIFHCPNITTYFGSHFQSLWHSSSFWVPFRWQHIVRCFM